MEFLLANAGAYILSKLPFLISFGKDLSGIVGGIKAGVSIFDFLKSNHPSVSGIVEELAKIFPKNPLISEAEHLESIAKALFSDFAYSPEQLEALKPYLPANTGGGSVGYNEENAVH